MTITQDEKDIRFLQELNWKEEVTEYLGDFWFIRGRPDLFQDAVDYVVEQHPVEDTNINYSEQILGQAFQFLQDHCTTAISSKDLEYMALADKERMIFTP